MHLGHAKPFGLEDCHPYRARCQRIVHLPDARVQGRKVQRIALAQVKCLMAEMSGFAAKLIMNLKIHLIVHHCPCLWV